MLLCFDRTGSTRTRGRATLEVSFLYLRTTSENSYQMRDRQKTKLQLSQNRYFVGLDFLPSTLSKCFQRSNLCSIPLHRTTRIVSSAIAAPSTVKLDPSLQPFATRNSSHVHVSLDSLQLPESEVPIQDGRDAVSG